MVLKWSEKCKNFYKKIKLAFFYTFIILIFCMLSSLFSKIFPSASDGIIKKLMPQVAKVNALEEKIQNLTDTELFEKTQEFKLLFAQGKSLESFMFEAIAVVRETSRRVLGMRHFDVQILGGLALHYGAIAEMKTGEGKTLVATIPIYLNSLGGKGAHLVTVNDFLARRDAQLMAPIYHALGLSVGVINDEFKSYVYDPNFAGNEQEVAAMTSQEIEELSYKIDYSSLKPCNKKEAYLADITYGTNTQFGFDYLRDNTVTDADDVVQREFNFAIVDEVDSILIDEARVPLILSTKSSESEELYKQFADIAQDLELGNDFTCNEKFKSVEVKASGIEKVEIALAIDNLFSLENLFLVHHLENALKAKSLYLNDREYVLHNNEVVIIDTFTGRMQIGRRWSDGLHQAIEAKEHVVIQPESRTQASITYQNFFKLYKKLSGMTGTAKTAEEEFRKVYGLDVVSITPNRPIVRKDLGDIIYVNENAKFNAMTQKVKELQQSGQPVLVGTASVEKNQQLSDYFTKAGIKHNTLNAKNHEQEGSVIANAGLLGAVTVATNMAGRGVDIKLGGIPFNKENEEKVKALGGLYVIGTERHEARSIDNQLRGRSGRQGDPGVTQFYISLDDSLMRIFAGEYVKKQIESLDFPEELPIANGFISSQIESAQSRIEGMNFDSRKHILSYDDIVTHHRKLIYKKRSMLLLEKDLELIKQELDLLVPYASFEEKEAIKQHEENLGFEVFTNIARQVMLSIIDRLWMDHLDTMAHTRQAVGLRAYGHDEPLVVYHKESLSHFKKLQDQYAIDVTNFLARLDIAAIQNQMIETQEKQ
jgi:preprotein translocase subunit SecA